MSHVISSNGFRPHWIVSGTERCWCNPDVEDGLIIHKDVSSANHDVRPRMAVYSGR